MKGETSFASVNEHDPDSRLTAGIRPFRHGTGRDRYQPGKYGIRSLLHSSSPGSRDLCPPAAGRGGHWVSPRFRSRHEDRRPGQAAQPFYTMSIGELLRISRRRSLDRQLSLGDRLQRPSRGRRGDASWTAGRALLPRWACSHCVSHRGLPGQSAASRSVRPDRRHLGVSGAPAGNGPSQPGDGVVIADQIPTPATGSWWRPTAVGAHQSCQRTGPQPRRGLRRAR